MESGSARIALVGGMAAGKTSVGKALAELLELPFADLDDMIVEVAGKSIPAIFGAEGEAAFRSRESDALKTVSRRLGGLVLACGGGTVLSSENRSLLREGFFTVWLKVRTDRAVDRAKAQGASRPLLSVDDPCAELERIMRAREPLYGICADMHFVQDGESGPEKAAKALLDEMERRGVV